MYSLNEIINKASHETYQHGEKCYYDGKVQNVHIYNNRTKFFIKDKEIYNVEIEMLNLKDKDKAKSVYCSCGYTGNGDVCKHIIAAVLYLKNNGLEKLKEIENKELMMLKNSKMVSVKNYLDNLNAEKEINKKKISIEYNIDFTNGVDVSLRIGKDKMHPVKDIFELSYFFNSNMSQMSFGEEFIFDKDKHYIGNGDLRNIKILEILPSLSLNDSIDKRNVPPELLIRILKLMNSKTVNIKMNNEYYSNVKCIFDKNLKLKLDIKNDYLTFSCDLMKDVVSYKYGKIDVKFNGSYLGLFEESSELLSIFADKGTGKIKIGMSDAQHFIDTLYNERYKENIIIEKDLSKLIEKKKFNVEIYLLKNGSLINAKVKFIEKKKKLMFTVLNDIERSENENIIAEILKGYGFINTEGKFILKEDRKIYLFFKNGISELEKNENIAVYYTQNLKKYYNKLNNIHINVTESSINMLDLNLQIDNFSKEEMVEILNGIVEKKKFIRLSSEKFVDLDSDSIEELETILEQLGNKSITTNNFKINKFQAVEMFHRVDKTKFDLNDSAGVSLILDKLINFKEDKITIDVLADVLREYQKEGVMWLKSLESCNLGGILADEMGLGKTIQVISLLAHSKNQSLIVVPSSLMYNWKKEFEKFMPEIKILVITGTKKKRQKLISEKDKYKVIITSYPLIRRDLECFIDTEFEYCILDEGQYIKNPDTKVSKSVKMINSKYRIVLSGTPIENNLIELWSIFEFILPGYLKSQSVFKKEFIKRGERGHEDLIRLTSPFILRRKKKDVLSELPEKIVNVVYSKLNDKQMKIYDSYLLDMKERLKELSEKKGMVNSQIEILSVLTRLRQICCDPGLFIKGYNEKSGKIELLEELVDELLEGNHKILIFSQFTSMLRIIEKLLKKKKISYSYLDGQVKVVKRGEIIEDFTSGKTNIFLISLKAGGTGLNLTEADTVIHVDPWWNPAVEDQATDRAHRIGQKDVVNVYKIITRNTIEEKIYEIQLRKRKLIDSVIEAKNVSEAFNSNEIFEVLNTII